MLVLIFGIFIFFTVLYILNICQNKEKYEGSSCDYVESLGFFEYAQQRLPQECKTYVDSCGEASHAGFISEVIYYANNDLPTIKDTILTSYELANAGGPPSDCVLPIRCDMCDTSFPPGYDFTCKELPDKSGTACF